MIWKIKNLKLDERNVCGIIVGESWELLIYLVGYVF